jgi:hypothetical protein
MEDRKRLFQLIQTLKSDSYQPPHLQHQQETRSSNIPAARKSPPVKENVSPPASISTSYQQSQSTTQQQQSGRVLNAYGIPVVSNSTPTSSIAAKNTSSNSIAAAYKNTSTLQSSLQKTAMASNTSIVTPVSERIRVCVRKRPLNQKELKRNEQDVTSVSGKRTIVITEAKYVCSLIV